MSKVEYNGSSVASVLQPVASEVRKFTTAAVAAVEKISYLDSFYGLGSIKENLYDCQNRIAKYCEWLNSINEMYQNNEVKMEEVLSKINVSKVTRRNTLIK